MVMAALIKSQKYEEQISLLIICVPWETRESSSSQGAYCCTNNIQHEPSSFYTFVTPCLLPLTFPVETFPSLWIQLNGISTVNHLLFPISFPLQKISPPSILPLEYSTISYLFVLML